MNKIYFLFMFFVMCATEGMAQGLPCPPTTNTIVSAGPDTTICPGNCVKFRAASVTSLRSTSAYVTDTPAYANFPYNVGTQVLVNMDDIWSSVVNIPFPFCYFGNTYNQLLIGSNGNVTFDISMANGSNAYSVTNPIPYNYSSYNNCILAPFFDMDPRGRGGSIRYLTFGTAPCRKFVISWDSCATFSCTSTTAPNDGGCPYRATQQIVLYETTNVIDINVKRHRFYEGSTSSGHGVIGIQNEDATLAYSFPDRNNDQWDEDNKSYRFIPDGEVTREYEWRNLRTGAIVSNTDSMTDCPPDTTSYSLRVQYTGSCDSVVKYDTVRANVFQAVVANFKYDIHYGCSEDTVFFINQSTGNDSNLWYFSDNTTDTAYDPVHIFPKQDTYTIKLVVRNPICADSVTQSIDLIHPLDAAFKIDDDSICQYQSIRFTNNSIATTRNNIPPAYRWDFGDGITDSTLNPVHQFQKPGIFRVRLYVTNFVPCTDTASVLVVVDTFPYLKLTVSDTNLCLGQATLLNVAYAKVGNTALRWDLGDGIRFEDITDIQHAYDRVGTFFVNVNASYRICPDTGMTQAIVVRNSPVVYLGNDTAMCPNAAPLVLYDRYASTHPGVRYTWNTGNAADTNFSLVVTRPGVYSATLRDNGCTATDSVTVLKDCYLDIANIFTPNGDGDNDYFLPRQLLSRGLTEFHMQLFNRWGQMLFQTSSIDGRGWDGKFNGLDQPEGVYIYIIDAGFKDGRSEHYDGNVTLLR